MATRTDRDPNPNTNPDPGPNTNPSPNPNTHPDPNTNPNTNPNTCSHSVRVAIPSAYQRCDKITSLKEYISITVH